MEVIILAGGFGTRLRNVVHSVPKPMADIKGRPFLSYLLDFFSGQRTARVLLSVGYMQDSIMDHFSSRYKEMNIAYVREDRPLGTGGAIRKALQSAHDDTVIVANGDSFFSVDLSGLLNRHLGSNADLTIAVKNLVRNDRYGTVLIKDDRAVGFLEKSAAGSGYINGGIYAMNRDRIITLLKKQADAFSFETDFLQKEVRNMNVMTYRSEGYFIDIGIPEDYERAKRELPEHIQQGAAG